MDFSYEDDDYQAPPEEVVRILVDPGFVREYAAELHAEVLDLAVEPAEGGLMTVAATLRVPTQGIPAIFKRLVGSSLTIVDRRTWAPSNGTYAGDIQVTVEVRGRKVDVDARQTLQPAGATSLFRATGAVTAKVPIIRGQVETAVRGLVADRESVLGDQGLVLRRWLSRGGPA